MPSKADATLKVRLPSEMKARIAARAAEHRRSQNAELVTLLESALAAAPRARRQAGRGTRSAEEMQPAG